MNNIGVPTTPYDVEVNTNYFLYIVILVAFLVKFAAKLEDKIGGQKIMNYSSFAALIPLLILGFGTGAAWTVALFFIVLIIDNLRSPVANNLFHEQVSSENRATMGSILELVSSVNKLWILPIVGYMADIYSIKTAILLIAAIILFNASFVWVIKRDRPLLVDKI